MSELDELLEDLARLRELEEQLKALKEAEAAEENGPA